MAELIPGVDYRAFLAEALRHSREASFRASPFFARHGAALEALLLTPRFLPGRGETGMPPPTAPGRSLRVIHWNIEKGKKLQGLKRRLADDPAFRDADICCLNEVDAGMARSGPNADVARELADALDAPGFHLPNYIECTLGMPGEAPAGSENELGIHGVAILTRLPVLDARVHPLPTAWDYFNYTEKRFGGRRGLYLRLAWGAGSIVAATAHLEMRTAPAGRTRQFAAFLEGLAGCEREWGTGLPTILTGDWNTHTFHRGGPLDPVRGYLRLAGRRPSRLEETFIRPSRKEPLFGLLRRAGFDIEAANDRLPTAWQALDTVEDLGGMPGWLGRGLLRAGGLWGRVLGLRLDWIATRGFRPAAPPRTLPPGADPATPLSDHAPIMADLA